MLPLKVSAEWLRQPLKSRMDKVAAAWDASDYKVAQLKRVDYKLKETL